VFLDFFLLGAVSSSDDPAVGDDGTSAEVESAAVLQGHLPGDLTSSSCAATDDLATGLEDLGAAELADTPWEHLFDYQISKKLRKTVFKFRKYVKHK